MQITINDLSFEFPFYEERQMMEAVRKFIRVCKDLESNRCPDVERIVGTEVDKEKRIGPNCTVYHVIQRLTDRNERAYFLSLLKDRGKAFRDQAFPFIYKGKESFVCASAKEEMTVSLESDAGLGESVLRGTIGESEADISNVSREEHFWTHRSKLGIRLYEANDIKHKKEKENYYGKGKTASPMDLPDQEAQELLNRAIWIKGRLYARRGIHNYTFQNTRDCIYHGYISDSLGDDIQRELYRVKWD